MEAVRALAEEIGPRPPCSKEEERAARWCAARLSEYGLAVEVEEFPSRRAYHPWYAVYFLLAAAGAVLTVAAPLAAFVLGITALLLYGREAEGRPLVRPRSATSRNVVARSAAAPRLVVVAHLDSAITSPFFRPGLVRARRASLVVLHAALVLVPSVSAGAWIGEAGKRLTGALWGMAAVLAASLVLAAVLQSVMARRARPVAGANDNASGVDVLLRLAASRPEATWFVVTGSEESGMLGMQAFLDVHGDEVGAARFLNIDSVGAGEIGAAWEEGVLRAHGADRTMLAAAEAAGARTFSFRLLPTDATVLLARRRKALSLLALDAHGSIPNWHRETDVAANVERKAIDRAEAIARAVMTQVLVPAARP